MGVVAALIAISISGVLSPASASASGATLDLAPLRVEGRHFVDPAGRVVILRGVNLTGDAKVPPFVPSAGPRDLDRVASLGMNVVRLVFIWEAYEPLPGRYDEGYLDALRGLARGAASRGVYTIVDIHQDGYSRHTSRGAGDGFPAWAVSRRGTPSRPDNSPSCANWPLLMATDRTTHRSFDDFFADAGGIRTRFLRMIDRVATAFATTPGVLGYDLMNEPWGDERRELAPLYEDMACVIRARHPAAILFIEGHVTTNCGRRTKLPRPSRDGFAYAPHYYKPLALVFRGWRGTRFPIDRAFGRMDGQVERWDCPLFVGEFGIAAGAKNAGDYVAAIYDRLDAALASGAQWNLTPGWDPRLKDGWNGEDFSIFDAAGRPRPNFRPRPYPRATAGTPLRFEFRGGAGAAPDGLRALVFTWDHRPERGDTEIALPDGLFGPGTRVDVTPANVLVTHDPARRSLVCRAGFSGPITVRMSDPALGDRAELRWAAAVSPGR
jgi:endoglycosylceramidase